MFDQIAAFLGMENQNIYVKALLEDKKGNWSKSHAMVQDLNDQKAAWIHAYLHRKEGDLFNASYWYQRAGRSTPDYSLDQEWQEIFDFLSSGDEEVRA